MEKFNKQIELSRRWLYLFLQMHCSFGEMHYLHALSFRKVMKSIFKNFVVQHGKNIDCPIDYENDSRFD